MGEESAAKGGAKGAARSAAKGGAKTATREGGCQCGAVRYRVEGEALAVGVCHCTDCQRQTGSAFGMSMLVPEAAFRLLAGELQSFTVKADSGRTKRCAFCPGCGTRIYHRVVDGVVSVKPGTLDDPSGLVPTVHVFTKSKQPWVPIPKGVPTFEAETR